MITEAGTNGCRQLCGCGSNVIIPYTNIKYKRHQSSPQLVLPVCDSCKAKIEFIFIGLQMTKPELQVFAQMQKKGLINDSI